MNCKRKNRKSMNNTASSLVHKQVVLDQIKWLIIMLLMEVAVRTGKSLQLFFLDYFHLEFSFIE